jgi:P-type Cu+ transporter
MKIEHRQSAATYVCPMHPEVRQDHPGTCPRCRMPLVSEEQGEQGQGAERHGRDGMAHSHGEAGAGDHAEMIR